jgi:hypothetical protein
MGRPYAGLRVKPGVVLKINKAARIIHKNDLPIDAAALNEGVPTGFRS